jgi:hypothetical protein
MPSARYYREQAQLLLGWALATRDDVYASRLTTQAMELLVKAREANDGRADLDLAVREFNETQLDTPHLTQRQQSKRDDEH